MCTYITHDPQALTIHRNGWHMEFDIPRQIGAVTRKLETKLHEGRPARVVVAARTYDTSFRVTLAARSPGASRRAPSA